jgi:hypothetical protein
MELRKLASVCAALLLPIGPIAQAAPAHTSEVANAMGDLMWGIGAAEVRMRLPADARIQQNVDASFLRAEVTGSSSESILATRDPTSRTFYFFIAGKLWKIYKAFDPLVFPEGNFAAFASMLERRFGPGKPVRGRWIEWRDRRTRLRAIDQTNSYGFYCLVFVSRAALNARSSRELE